MAVSNAIIARMGLDTSGIAKGMQEAASRIGFGGKQIEQSLNRISQASRKAGEEQKAAAADAGRGLSEMTQTLISSQNAADAFAQSATILANSLKLGLGATAAIGIGTALIERIRSVAKEADDLKVKLDGALRPGAPTANTSLEDMREQLRKTQEVAAEFQERLKSPIKSYFSDLVENSRFNPKEAIKNAAKGYLQNGIVGAVKNVNDKGGASDRAERNEAKTMEVNAALAKEMVNREQLIADVEEKRVKLSERLAEIAKIELDFKGKIKKAGQANDGTAQRTAGLKRQMEVAVEEAKMRHAAEDRTIAAERASLEAKKGGLDVEQQLAKARVNAAQAELDAGGPEEKRRANELALESAKHDLVIAERKTDELKAQLALLEKIAKAEVSPEEKARMLNEGERENIQSRIDDPRTTEDERREARVELAKNEEQARALAKAQREQGYQAQNSEIDATTGRGEAEQIEAVRRKLEVARQKAGDVTFDPASSDAEKKAANAAVNQLAKQYDELVEARDRVNAAAKAEVEFLELQIKGQDTLIEKLRTKLDFDLKIKQALKDGNTELATQLQKQQQLSLYQKGLENFKKTPEQRRQERQKRREEERDARRYDAEVAQVKRDMANGVTFSEGSRKGEIAKDIKNGTLGKRDMENGSGNQMKDAMSGTEAKLDRILTIMGGGLTNR